MATVSEFYGRWAAHYDRLATAPGVGRWRRAAARRVADPGDVVVDLGCGSGATLPRSTTSPGSATRRAAAPRQRPTPGAVARRSYWVAQRP